MLVVSCNPSKEQPTSTEAASTCPPAPGAFHVTNVCTVETFKDVGTKRISIHAVLSVKGTSSKALWSMQCDDTVVGAGGKPKVTCWRSVRIDADELLSSAGELRQEQIHFEVPDSVTVAGDRATIAGPGVEISVERPSAGMNFPHATITGKRWDVIVESNAQARSSTYTGECALHWEDL